MKTLTPQKQQATLDRMYYPRRHQKQLTYKLKSYLPQIKVLGRQNNLLNITKQTISKRQMLYLDFYESSGIRILEKSPEHQPIQEDDNQTFGKVKVMELNNLSEECKKTLNYFSVSKDQRLKRDSVRRSIFSKLHSSEKTKQTIDNIQKPVNSREQSNSPRRRIYLNVAERNRRLPKKQKYLIQKFGIVTGQHMFKVQSKKSLSVRFSTPQTIQKNAVSPIRPILSTRQPKQQTLASKLKSNNQTFYNSRPLKPIDSIQPQRYQSLRLFQSKQTINAHQQ